MWAPLSSPVHLEHYAYDGLGDDWPAMRRVVATLSARDYAATLFAYTSLDLFCITFSPQYDEWGGSGTVVLAFDSRRQLFDVKYDGFDKQDRARYRCEETDVVRVVDALVLRMSLTRRDPIDRAPRRT